jgi:hypothetical protein
MSEDNHISAAITPENIAAILQKFQEIRALCPALEQLDDASLRRLLGIDQTIDLDNIAREAVTQHPEFKPAVVDLAEYAKDRALLDTTAPLESEGQNTLDLIILMRRYAASDVRKATNAIYGTLGEFAARGNATAQNYYDRMSAYYPSGRKKTAPTPAATPKP